MISILSGRLFSLSTPKKTRDCKDHMAYCVRNKIYYSPKLFPARARIASSTFGDNLSRLRLCGLLHQCGGAASHWPHVFVSLTGSRSNHANAKSARKIQIQGSVGNLLYYSMCQLLQLFPHAATFTSTPFQANSP